MMAYSGHSSDIAAVSLIFKSLTSAMSFLLAIDSS